MKLRPYFALKVLFHTVLFFVGMNSWSAKAQDLATESSFSKIKKVSPVIFYADTIFSIEADLGSLSAKERAERTTNKLKALIEKDEFDTTLLHLLKDEIGVELFHGEQILSSITSLDTLGKDKTQEELANEIVNGLKKSYAINYSEKAPITKLIRSATLIGIFLFLFLTIRLLNKWINVFIRLIVRKLDVYLKGIKIKDYQLLSPEREEKLMITLLRILKFIFLFLLIYLTLPLTLSLFPSTRRLADTLLRYITEPLLSFFDAFLGFLPDLFIITLILIGTHYFIRFIQFLGGEIEVENLKIDGFYPEWAKPTVNLVKVIIIAFSFILIFPYLPGSESPAFRGVSVFLGVLISLGSSSAISNIIAGLVIIYMRAFKIGDRVTIGDSTGDVLEKNMLVTRIRTIKNEEITIPNATILNGKTINFSKETGPGLVLHSTATIGYDVSWRLVHELMISAAKKTTLILDEPAPFVLQTSLDDFYVSYQINAYTKSPHKAALIYSELHGHIQDAFNEAGVEIMSPHYRAARDGNQSTIPENYLPKDYRSPSFKIQNTKES